MENRSKYREGDRLVCPQCGRENDLRAEYCWACHFDFVPNDAPCEKPAEAEPPQVIRKFRGKVLRMYIRLILIIPLLLPYFRLRSLRRAGRSMPSEIFGMSTASFQWLFLLLLIIVLVWGFLDWRCPKCNGYLGRPWRVFFQLIEYCPKCGVRLREGST